MGESSGETQRETNPSLSQHHTPPTSTPKQSSFEHVIFADGEKSLQSPLTATPLRSRPVRRMSSSAASHLEITDDVVHFRDVFLGDGSFFSRPTRTCPDVGRQGEYLGVKGSFLAKRALRNNVTMKNKTRLPQAQLDDLRDLRVDVQQQDVHLAWLRARHKQRRRVMPTRVVHDKQRVCPVRLVRRCVPALLSRRVPGVHRRCGCIHRDVHRGCFEIVNRECVCAPNNHFNGSACVKCDDHCQRCNCNVCSVGEGDFSVNADSGRCEETDANARLVSQERAVLRCSDGFFVSDGVDCEPCVGCSTCLGNVKYLFCERTRRSSGRPARSLRRR